MTDPRWQTLPQATRIRWIRVLDDYNPIALTPLSRIALRTLAVQGNADGSPDVIHSASKERFVVGT